MTRPTVTFVTGNKHKLEEVVNILGTSVNVSTYASDRYEWQVRVTVTGMSDKYKWQVRVTRTSDNDKYKWQVRCV